VAERAFEAFRRGDVLVRWDYPPAMWDAYVAAETRRSRRSVWIVLAIIFLPMLAMAAWIGYAVPERPTQKLKACAIAVSAVIALAGVARLLGQRFVRRRATAMVACPRAHVGLTAIYCGGTFNFWGSQLRALQRVSIEPAPAPASRSASPSSSA